MIICGDALTELCKLPDESVHCCVTSPPYWGLRDYGTAKWEGGDPDCDHSPERRGGRFATPVSRKQASNAGSGTASRRDCPCGAIRVDSQLGLERTPEEYVANLVAVFREVRRVLRKDGTLWLNLGDCYNSQPPGNTKPLDVSSGLPNSRANLEMRRMGYIRPQTIPGLKPKDLVGIPWRVAFALQADGWYLRSDIIWAKPNPMPESVRDRPTRSHEYVFLMSKSAKYYYDAEAVREPVTDTTIMRCSQDVESQEGSWRVPGKTNGPMKAVLKQDATGKRMYMGFNERYFKNEKRTGRYNPEAAMRNQRSVWTITTKPFKEAHFATFPPEIPERCIKAGCPLGGVVLDPFFGAGTTGMVAKQLGRHYIGIELNPEYCEMARRRISGVAYQQELTA